MNYNYNIIKKFSKRYIFSFKKKKKKEYLVYIIYYFKSLQ